MSDLKSEVSEAKANEAKRREPVSSERARSDKSHLAWLAEIAELFK